jgi:branched-subunit amino acid aminotransferase/4-amino-4-deoxychorismate lyase
VEERTLPPADLYAADEVFISSTNRSMLGVSEINGHKIAGAPGPVTKKLERVFAGYMREYIDGRAAASGKH